MIDILCMSIGMVNMGYMMLSIFQQRSFLEGHIMNEPRGLIQQSGTNWRTNKQVFFPIEALPNFPILAQWITRQGKRQDEIERIWIEHWRDEVYVVASFLGDEDRYTCKIPEGYFYSGSSKFWEEAYQEEKAHRPAPGIEYDLGSAECEAAKESYYQ